ncbi:putative Epsin-1-like 3, partial [Homarus americanus]
DRPQSTPQDRPQNTPQDRPPKHPTGAGPRAPHRTGTQSTPQDRPQSTSQDRPQSTPQNRPQSTPQGRPQSTPQDRPQSTSQDRPHSTPQDRSQSRPQDLLRVTLHPDPQTTPPMTPQTVRQSPLAATLQNTTRTTTKSIFDSPELEGYSLRSVVHSSQRQQKSAMSEVGPHSSSPDRGCVSTSSSSLLLALRTPIYEHPQSPGHTLAPPETPALLRSLPDMRPITQNVLPRNSTRRASVSQTGSHTRRMEPCNTPYLDPCTMKSVITTPVSRVYTPNNGHSSVKIESSTTTIEPYSPTNGPCVLKSESVSPENELHTMRTPDNLGIPRTPKITPNPRFPHLTPVVPHTPKISNGMDTSRRPSARNLILESTLASISIMTEDSQEQESSAAISSCSQESIQLTRQYSLKASSGVL